MGRSMILNRLSPQAPDALLALIRLHAADPRAHKIDLGVGVYRTEEGTTPVFAAIKAAEHARVARTIADVDFDLYLHSV